MAISTNQIFIEGYVYFDNKKYITLTPSNVVEVYLYNSINNGYYCFLKIKDVKQLFLSTDEFISNKSFILFHQIGQEHQILKDLKFKLVKLINNYNNSKYLNNTELLNTENKSNIDFSNSDIWIVGYSEAQYSLMINHRISDDSWFKGKKISNIVSNILNDNNINITELTDSKMLSNDFSFTSNNLSDFEILQKLKYLMSDNLGKVPFVFLFNNNSIIFHPASLNDKSKMKLKIDNREWVYDYADRRSSLNKLDWLTGYDMDINFRNKMNYIYKWFDKDKLTLNDLSKTNDESFLTYFGNSISNNFKDIIYFVNLFNFGFFDNKELASIFLKNIIANDILYSNLLEIQVSGNLFIVPDSVISLDLNFEIERKGIKIKGNSYQSGNVYVMSVLHHFAYNKLVTHAVVSRPGFKLKNPSNLLKKSKINKNVL